MARLLHHSQGVEELGFGEEVVEPYLVERQEFRGVGPLVPFSLEVEVFGAFA
jgi:hypothetical protein